MGFYCLLSPHVFWVCIMASCKRESIWTAATRHANPRSSCVSRSQVIARSQRGFFGLPTLRTVGRHAAGPLVGAEVRRARPPEVRSQRGYSVAVIFCPIALKVCWLIGCRADALRSRRRWSRLRSGQNCGDCQIIKPLAQRKTKLQSAVRVVHDVKQKRRLA